MIRVMEPYRFLAVIHLYDEIPEQVESYDPVHGDAQGRGEIDIPVEHHEELLVLIGDLIDPEIVSFRIQSLDRFSCPQSVDGDLGYIPQFNGILV